MPWDINQINQQFMQNLPDVGGAFRQGQQDAFKERIVREQYEAQKVAQQLAQQRAAQKQADVQAALAEGSPQAFARLQAMYPEDREAYASAWGALDADQKQTELRELSSIHGYLQSGMPDRAKARLQARIDADKKAGIDTSEEEEMLAAIDEDPVAAARLAKWSLYNLVEDKEKAALFGKIGEEGRAEELQPSVVRKASGEAAKVETEAQYAPQVIESNLASEASTRARQAAQTAIENANLSLGWERLALDKDTLATNTQLKLEEMLQAGQEVKGASLEELTKSVGSAQQNEALATRTRALAEEMAASDMRGAGWRSWFGETYAGAFGTQDAVTALRGQYEQIKNTQAIKNLPPGPATDKDIEIAMRGFPPATADKEFIVSFLRGLAKMQEVAAQGDQRKADWISSNGNLGTSRRDINVGGVMVPAGTTFGEFNRNAVKVSKRGEAPTRGYLDRYGNVPDAPASLRKR